MKTAITWPRLGEFMPADVRDNLLGAVFGEMDEAAAGALLAKTLGTR